MIDDRFVMDKIEFSHGGRERLAKYLGVKSPNSITTWKSNGIPAKWRRVVWSIFEEINPHFEAYKQDFMKQKATSKKKLGFIDPTPGAVEDLMSLTRLVNDGVISSSLTTISGVFNTRSILETRTRIKAMIDMGLILKGEKAYAGSPPKFVISFLGHKFLKDLASP